MKTLSIKTFISLGLLFVISYSTTLFAADKKLEQEYHFKLGTWHIEAKSMNPDRTYNKGVGTSNVYYMHDKQVIQDDLKVEFEDGTVSMGSTMRTFDGNNNVWHITWIGTHAASGSGQGIYQKGQQFIEEFTGSDQYGNFIDTMTFSIKSKNKFTAKLNRTYLNGNVNIGDVWSYSATRVTK